VGEYAYRLVVPRGEAAALRDRLLDEGRALDLREVGSEALDHCALEAGAFNVRREGRARLSPLELQLQWRLAGRDFTGAAAVRARRAAGIRARTTGIASAHAFTEGTAVRLDGEPIGRVLSAGFSPARRDSIGLALLDLPLAHPGVDRFTVDGADGARLPMRTVSPPFVLQRSLFVDPRHQRYARRAEYPFPPLA
jgi:sarcosine oxidase subunit alpha